MFNVKIPCLIILIAYTLNIYSQGKNLITKENADCDRAIVLDDTVYGPTNAPDGYGKVMEIRSDKADLYYFEREHNTVWYKFTVPQACVLSLDIIPVDIKNDYDFLVFKYTDSNFCKDIKNKKLKPVRSNISRNDPVKGGITGLSKDANELFVHSGPGSQYSKALDVKKGEVYYLVLDNVYKRGKGHTLKLYYTDCADSVISSDMPDTAYINVNLVKKKSAKDTLALRPVITEFTNPDIPVKYAGVINIDIKDQKTKQALKGSADIYSTSDRNGTKPEFHSDSISNCKVTLDKRKDYYLIVTAKGYMNSTTEINFKKEQTKLNVKTKAQKIEKGRSFKISNIFFYGNKDVFLPESTPALEHLLNFMNQNPTVKVEIQGHVNYPVRWGIPRIRMKNRLQLLSDKRAMAVRNFLIKNDIHSNRVKWKGYSNSRMLYPHARNKFEKQQNRRVEIKILEK